MLGYTYSYSAQVVVNLFRLRTLGGFGEVALKNADKGVIGTDKVQGGPLKGSAGKCSRRYDVGARRIKLVMSG